VIKSLSTYKKKEKIKMDVVLEKRNTRKFWVAKNNWRVSAWTDGEQFFTGIQAGLDGETFLSVGYSCPNFSGITDSMLNELGRQMDAAWEKEQQVEFDEMLPALYRMCQVANQAFNELLMKEMGLK
jgi:hypothetical protein